MLKVRLSRTGRKNYPSYRIVITDSRNKRDGKCIEIIGHYNPQDQPPKLDVKQNRLDYWLDKGAQLSEGARKILKA
ncbi:30S ribosomal protein S16 [Patescibacteria group bacterium]|nr:30S ribosomal protein S16 [Patescibacteria group bacterium]MBU1868112.1 30S ribosomal protein S16 [Patescibacteria group bacterium]